MKQIKASDFTDEHFGLPTILDILSELEKTAVANGQPAANHNATSVSQPIRRWRMRLRS
ncbi:TPA: hypothetical protein ACFJN9_001076 [Neisseria gonorrhoeae]